MNNGRKDILFGNLLSSVGFHSSGNELLYNGQTGVQLEADIFIGPTYYMRLKHLVKDKMNHRAKGPKTLLTRQTVQGRANDGGLRIGEMERDGIISHGANYFLQESMLTRGDDYYMAVCNKTGMTAIYNEKRDLFISPLADGPIKFSGTMGDDMNVQQITKYGRSFSVIRVPYTFKLLLQELQTMHVQMRMVTSDNVNQIYSMGFSDNLIKLTGKSSLGDIYRKQFGNIIKGQFDIGNTTPSQDILGAGVVEPSATPLEPDSDTPLLSSVTESPSIDVPDDEKETDKKTVKY